MRSAFALARRMGFETGALADLLCPLAALCGLGLRATLWALLLLTSACTVGPDYLRPEAPDFDHYARDVDAAHTPQADGLEQHFVREGQVAAAWWQQFGVPELDALLERALQHSPTLQAAEASLRASQDRLRAGSGVFYPQASLAAGASRSRSAAATLGQSGSGTLFTLLTLSGSISYDLDVFGRHRREVEGLRAVVDENFYLQEAARLTLTANLVNASIAAAAYRAEAESLQRLIVLQSRQLAAAEVQYRGGVADYAVVLADRAAVAGNQALLASLRLKAGSAAHLLASLAGNGPEEPPAVVPQLSEFHLPEALPLSLPSSLVRQRPDILAAEARLHEASAAVGVATAALYPDFSLSADLGQAAAGIASLPEASRRFWSVGGTLGLPLFSGGSLWNARAAAREDYLVAQGTYRQTVLNAFAQVADVLLALQQDALALQAQSDVLEASRRAHALRQAAWQGGMVAGQDVLAAEVVLEQASLAHSQALGVRQQDNVALLVALGGGWWHRSDSKQAAAPP